MTKVSYFLVDELPPVADLVVGGIYYLNDGRQFIVKSDKSVLEIGKVAEDEIKYDQSVRIDTLPNYFTAKKTVTTFSRASSGATGFLSHLENNYRLNSLEYDVNMIVTVETERLSKSGGEESVVQTITLKYYSDMGDPWGESVLQSIGKLVRVKVEGANRFRDMALYPVNIYLKDMPASGLNGAYYGLAGATINIASTDTKYVCVSDLQSGFSSKWKKTNNPTVLDVTDAPTPPQGEEYVYSAESVKDMVDTHASIIASETVLGHVKIDGETITIDNEGVISTNSKNKEVVLLDYDLGLDIPVEDLPLGYTLSYFSEENVSEEKDMWVSMIGEYTYWAYPIENYTLSVFTTNDGEYVSQKVDIGMYYVDHNNVVRTGLMGNLYRTGSLSEGYVKPTVSINSIVGSEPEPENKVYAFRGVVYNSTGEGKRFYKHDEHPDVISDIDWSELPSEDYVHFEAHDYWNPRGYDVGITIQSPRIDMDDPFYQYLLGVYGGIVGTPAYMEAKLYFTVTTNRVAIESQDISSYDVYQEITAKLAQEENMNESDYNIVRITRRGNSFTSTWDIRGYELPTIAKADYPTEEDWALFGTTWVNVASATTYRQVSNDESKHVGNEWVEVNFGNVFFLDNGDIANLRTHYDKYGVYYCDNVSGTPKFNLGLGLNRVLDKEYLESNFNANVTTTRSTTLTEQIVNVEFNFGRNEEKLVSKAGVKLKRTADNTTGAWNEFTIEYDTMQGKGDPNANDVYGVNGNKYYDIASGKTYKLTNTSEEFNLTRNPWVEINSVGSSDVMTTISEADLFSVRTLKSAKYYVERTGDKLPEGVDTAYVEVVMQETQYPNIMVKNYFCLGMGSSMQLPIPIYWTFEEIEMSENGAVLIAPLAGWFPIGDGEAIQVADLLTSRSSTAALSAKQGFILKGMIDEQITVINAVANFLNEHVRQRATPTVFGHVKYDNDTILMDTEGQIYVPPATTTNKGIVQVSNSYTATTNATVPTSSALSSGLTNVTSIINNVNGDLTSHKGKIASASELGHVKVDGKTVFIDREGTISATPSLRYRSIESVGLEVGDLREYEITPDIALVIKRTIRNGHVSASLKSIHGVELTGLDVQWRATTTYNLDDGVLGADEVKVIDTGIYVNNTEYPSFMIRYNNRVFRGEVMISGYLTSNKFFVFSEEL